MRTKIVFAMLAVTALSVRMASAQSPVWSGGYAGGDIGLGWGTSTGTFSNAAGFFPVPYDFKINGLMFGVFGGGNWQQNHLVLGGEFDWQQSRVKGDSGLVTEAITLTKYVFTTSLKSDISIRGRLGVAANRVLVFGTAGWTWDKWSTDYAFDTIGSTFVTNEPTPVPRRMTFGGGLEAMAGRHLLIRGEYRYISPFTSSYVNDLHNSAEAGNKVSHSDIRFGVGVKF
jgi:outer membrane immunogenic protein